MRDVCRRCRRPATACCCAHLAPVASTTRVVFLQHPRERRVKIGTCRMAHLALANSELRHGIRFEDDPHVRRLATAADTALLFPGPGAEPPDAFAGAPPRTLLVIDGTWGQARKVLLRNPALTRLPRIGITPAAPGRYRIRREPAAHCLSTIEAVVAVLGRLEGDPVRFAPMLRAFEQMVEQQLVRAAAGSTPYRRTPHSRRRPDFLTTLLDTRPADIVLAAAEANAHPTGAGVDGPAEMIQLTALRPTTGERFATLIAPRRPLAPAAPYHLDVPAARLLAGESIAAALARWREFLRRDDVICSWGRYTLDLLRAEGAAGGPLVDLRAVVSRRLGRRPGGVERAALLLGAERVPEPSTIGRAGRRIAALAEVVARYSTLDR